MDSADLDVWIEAQRPQVFQEAQQLRPGDGDVGASASFAEELANDGLRQRAIRDAGISYGAQAALAWRYEQLLKIIREQEGTLDVIMSFNPFVVDEHMLLPSVTESRNRFDLSSDQQELRSVNIQYILDEPPRAISQPPTWRDYLWREFDYPEPPHPALLPENREEVAIWEAGVKRGWEDGLRQAQLSFENNLNTLVRAIKGRITYRILETRNVVQRPVMTRGQPRVTQSEDGEILNAGELVYSITVPVDFNPASQWGALWHATSTEEGDFTQRGIPDTFGGEPIFKE